MEQKGLSLIDREQAKLGRCWIKRALSFVVTSAVCCLMPCLVLGGALLATPSSARADDPLNRTTPLYTEYNTFLKSQNWLELISAGSKPVDVTVQLFNSDGSPKGNAFNLTIAAFSQRDTQIFHPFVTANNKVSGDTYGLVQIKINNLSDPNVKLLGRMSVYRQRQDDGTYEFAYGLPLRGALLRKTHSFANSIDPSGKNEPVYNWTSIVNLSPTSQLFFYRRYRQAGGQYIRNGMFTLGPNQKCDLEGGHEDGQGVFLNEIEPADPNVPYISTSMRYAVLSRNMTGAVLRYSFAFPSFARSSVDGVFAPLSNRENTQGPSPLRFEQTNWVEIANTTASPVTATATFRDQNGVIIEDKVVNLAPHAQVHVNGDQLLNQRDDEFGTVQISSSPANSIVAQSIVYYKAGGRNELLTAYNIQADLPTQSELVGSYNTNLEMFNELIVSGTNSNPKTITLEVNAGATTVPPRDFSLPNYSTAFLPLSDGTFGIGANRLGTLFLDVPAPQPFMAYILRVRPSQVPNRPQDIEFVLPTLVR